MAEKKITRTITTWVYDVVVVNKETLEQGNIIITLVETPGIDRVKTLAEKSGKYWCKEVTLERVVTKKVKMPLADFVKYGESTTLSDVPKDEYVVEMSLADFVQYGESTTLKDVTKDEYEKEMIKNEN